MTLAASVALKLFLKKRSHDKVFFLKEKVSTLLFSKGEISLSWGPQYYTRGSRWGIWSIIAGAQFVVAPTPIDAVSPTVTRRGVR
jgi:hypothetical protein